MTRIASHRGGTLEFGDSTRQGFIATAKMELEEVEFDVHPTVDGHIVVHHDPTLDRTTDSTGIIAQMPMAQVCAATIKEGAGGHPLLLEQLCEVFANSPVAFRCEIKAGADGKPYRNFVPAVIEQLKAHDRLASTIFSSFNIETLVEIGSACDRPRLWLVNPTLIDARGIGSVIAVAIEHDVAELGINIDQATPPLRDEIVSAGLDFGCWGAHSAEQIDKALALGAKVFTSDRPSLAIERRTLWNARNEVME
ncbi:glycerophosphodiester phosphodiesterase family protein [Pelagibacterium sp. H642]|uniref:glycerophosphodiester phosphodiesterase family protein n=1 Tax=Pelagibacterium sp. H642 TaxID=1881069 RepID=UPI0028155C83|nr:glycerophosphodiester phosphodiesterase family protein [Pelagibacterium sp. H642]WMT92653.1 glycerophosphodiester phosphodiesterase [Pelagibacterium sp. H642]